MKNYFKIMLDAKNRVLFAEECRKGNFIGVDYGIRMDLTKHLNDDKSKFIHELVPEFLKHNSHHSKIAANLYCNTLWTLACEIQIGDIVVCPNGRRVLYFGEVTGNYFYEPNNLIPHRRAVNWFPATFKRNDVSDDMRRSLLNESTSIMISQHAEEIQKYIAGNTNGPSSTMDQVINDPTVFALEKHLEDFLVQNWKQTELGKTYDIYEEDGEVVGQQYPSDTGNIDILAISKNKKELLVVELKKGRASDAVVGQIQRYMGYVKEELAEEDQIVKGIIVALDDDRRIKRALSMTNNIDFYRYQVSFKLLKN